MNIAQPKPNILLIMVDQLIPFLTGAYGHPVVKTPNLNRLVREGIRFEAAYSPCPVCGPARASLMTGRYSSQINAWDNAAPLSEDEPTIAHYLTLAGYDAVLSGKMHFVGADQLHGFQRRLTTDIYPADFSWTPTRGVSRQTVKGHARDYIGDNIHIGRWNQYLSYDEETHFRALEYLHAMGLEQSNKEGRKPFFLCVSYHHPHEPFWPPRKYWDLYEGLTIDIPTFPANLEETYSTLDTWLNYDHGISQGTGLKDPESLYKLRRSYYSLVSYIDDKVGELLDALEESSFHDNTVVIFCSDHGDMLGERGMVQKRTFYEWSSRVPLIIRLPEERNGGRTYDHPVSLIDLLPTLLDIAGIEERLPTDGTSLMGLLNEPDSKPQVVFSEYHSAGVHAPCFMARGGDFKYVYIHGYNAQLFDLKADPGEWHNLSNHLEYQEVAERLKSLILEQFDPDAIDRAIMKSIARRSLIKRAMELNQTRWDYTPRFDATKSITEQYLRHQIWKL